MRKYHNIFKACDHISKDDSVLTFIMVLSFMTKFVNIHKDSLTTRDYLSKELDLFCLKNNSFRDLHLIALLYCQKHIFFDGELPTLIQSLLFQNLISEIQQMLLGQLQKPNFEASPLEILHQFFCYSYDNQKREMTTYQGKVYVFAQFYLKDVFKEAQQIDKDKKFQFFEKHQRLNSNYDIFYLKDSIEIQRILNNSTS